jgi:dTDP-4-amino-4,6-dideoxygalactose transaminase
MTNDINKFRESIYITRPLFPDYDLYTNRLKEIWDSKWLSNGGPQHARLEKLLLSYLNIPYLSLFNNGTTALTVAIQALRLQGEVITTPFSFPATTHSLAWNNITPVFCDIDLDTMTIDPNKIEQLITNRTTAILGVHVYGIPCHFKEIQDIADRHGLRVIYDAAHAFGTEIDDQPIGKFGDITMFSFHPTKLFHTSEGGALVYNDINLKQRIDLLKNFGIKNEFEVTMPGINGKMNEMSALMGQCVLQIVDEEKDKRQIIRDQYKSELDNVAGIKIINVGDNVKDSQQYMVIRIQEDKFGINRDNVYDNLRSYNVHARKYFYPLISDYPCYSQLSTANDDVLINSRIISEEVLCLPFYSELTELDILKICEIIKIKVACDE